MQDFRSRKKFSNPAELARELLEKHAEKMELARELPQIKRGLLKQERTRLARMLGAGHPRVRALGDRLAQTAPLAREVERLVDLRQIETCEVAEGHVLLHGQVRDEFGRPLHNAKVVLTDAKCHPFKGKSVRSDAHGYYAFDLASKEAGELARRKARVTVMDLEDKPLFTADEPLDAETSPQTVYPSVRRAAVRGPIMEKEGTVRERKQPRDREKPPPGKDLPRIPELEEITGIGKIRARKLSKAGIRDLRTLSETSNGKLRNVLGNLDVTRMKKEAEEICRRSEKRQE